jgi:hypothetical protein
VYFLLEAEAEAVRVEAEAEAPKILALSHHWFEGTICQYCVLIAN